MKKKLVVVTTDMEIELVMFVDANKLANTREAVSIARKKYYEISIHTPHAGSDSKNHIFINKYRIIFVQYCRNIISI